MARLTSDFWVSAFLRRHGGAAVLRRRGAASAGAIFIKIDRLDGTADLYAPAPQSLIEADRGQDRLFVRVFQSPVDYLDVEAKLAREISFDSDVWIVELDARDGDGGLELASV